ncbi:carbonic anhydrase 14 [Nothoprocta perdicaria]|uniref:carbonic anhydrase 14 n=1 Tax=Nothoprocta perdicaria TaxID=30464 RepID=UPI000E1C156D|nr:carbonic anhydrase 14 [Nothoprocta perdicaria]
MLLALALLQGLAPALAAAGPHGQERWAEGFPACGGRAQSPIDIETRWAQPEPALPPLQPYGAAAGTWELTNNGHTVVLALPRALTLHGLPGAFATAQLHLHWGGSEHLVDGRAAAGELHVVLFDAARFGGTSDALGHAGGLAVLAALLEPGPEPNAAYDNILRHLGSVRYAGQSTSIPAFDVRQLLPARLDLYYRYNGSLTTPPCSQGVIWSVFQEPVRVGSAQVGPLSLPAGPTGYGAGEVVAIVLGTGAGCAGLVLAVYFVAKRMR